jgi:hypothetical protein
MGHSYQLCSTHIEKKKGHAIMHEIELLTIWFSSVYTGMILTMLMPRMVSALSGDEGTQDGYERLPAHQRVHERAGSMIPIGKEA